MEPPAKTMVMGEPKEWTSDILAEWEKRVVAKPFFRDGHRCIAANYFSPRPWRNEYDRGSDEYGFTYTMVNERGAILGVVVCTWRPSDAT